MTRMRINMTIHKDMGEIRKRSEYETVEEYFKDMGEKRRPPKVSIFLDGSEDMVKIFYDGVKKILEENGDLIHY